MADLDAKRKRIRVKRQPGLTIKRATKAQRRDNWQATREAVLRRANGRCEMCESSGWALDAHHLLSGPLRRKYEAENTVVAICWPCHNGIHGGLVMELSMAYDAATRIGAPDIVLAALNRRLEKVTE